ncbi:hypothetical protein [Suttonella indologenes]|uniref:Uncharacterized protein n=1 Tax=Suttonella indologenes TaxID=13276 RepID=A0A380MKZ5_9GAMM|nr:hypothetical protein [Suttonella indologenes]SUO92225.1 Uncharacterised protein [Suttonella indologenes]
MFKFLLSYITLEDCSKDDLKLTLIIWVMIFLFSIYNEIVYKPLEEYREYMGKTIVFKGPFDISYSKGGGRIPSEFIIHSNIMPARFSSSCIGVELYDFCSKKRRVLYKFNEEYELNYYVRNIEKSRFIGLIISVKKNGDYIFQNKHLNRFLLPKKIWDFFYIFWYPIIFWYIFISYNRIKSISKKENKS